MERCESCKYWPDADNWEGEEVRPCITGVNIHFGCDPDFAFGCTLWEGKPKSIEFETIFERVRCVPATVTFPERDLPCIAYRGEGFFKRKFKVTLEPTE